MPDQSFNLFTISSALKKGDFYSHKHLATDAGKALEISGAVFLANSSFIDSNPLETISVRGRKVHRPKDFARTLIVRKLYQNLAAVLPVSQPGRKHILRNIRSILIEGLPYRVYKADVRKFYESFDHAAIMNRIDTLPVSDHTKLLTMSILNQHWKAGYRGLPVGLSLSSPLSEMMMSNFDAYVRGHEAVHYYARYVDDLLIISSGQERQRVFETNLSLHLPIGLQFGRNKSYCRETLLPLTSPFELSFLGYRFRISTGKKLAKGREVTADVSNNKVKKLKTRIMRSLISFSKSHDFLLLEKRIQFLTSNLSLPKAGSSVRQLIGLGHMYPDLTGESASLAELDVFLRSSILSSNGRSFATYALSRKQKNKLLAYSFARGHTKNKFFYFSHKTVEDIQRCWSLED